MNQPATQKLVSTIKALLSLGDDVGLENNESVELVVLRPDAAAEGLTVADLRAFLAEQRNNIQAQQEVTRLQLKLVSLHEYIEGDDGCEGELTPSLRGHPAGV